ncbi:MAG TPA: YhcG family protein, partial [Verrucomicrobiales bacterium]|nr:YhcG family protein [Verrucomicrobiales bacterium]
INELEISQSLAAELASGQKSQTVSGFSARPDFAVPVATLIQKLTFSHFVELLRVGDPLQRAFYEIECVKAGWSVRELKRQIGSLLFERLGLSTDKEKLLRLTAAEVTPSLPADIIKDPYIFEFLGLKPKEVFRENDLETALLDHLQEFLLELGNGFCFEDRQKKIRIGRSDYFVDLVFYHRKLHCHVLIEFHPMRYEPTEVSLRLCFAKRKRRAFLHRIHKRPEAQTPRTPRGKSQVYVKPFAAKAGLLRGLHHSSGRHQTREIP